MKVPGQGSYYKLQAKQTIFNYTQEDEPAAVEELVKWRGEGGGGVIVKVSYNEGRPDDLLHDQRGHNQVDFIVRKYGLNESTALIRWLSSTALFTAASQQSTKKVLGGLSSDNPNHSQASSSSPSGLESSYSPMRYTYCGLTIEVDVSGHSFSCLSSAFRLTCYRSKGS
eukprot:766538-Hanusia_phi.AAC.3